MRQKSRIGRSDLQFCFSFGSFRLAKTPKRQQPSALKRLLIAPLKAARCGPSRGTLAASLARRRLNSADFKTLGSWNSHTHTHTLDTDWAAGQLERDDNKRQMIIPLDDLWNCALGVEPECCECGTSSKKKCSRLGSFRELSEKWSPRWKVESGHQFGSRNLAGKRAGELAENSLMNASPLSPH